MDRKPGRGGDNAGDNTATVRRRTTKQPPPCRYGAECRNIGKCKFLHPPSAEVTNATNNDRASKSVLPSSPSRTKRKTVPKPDQREDNASNAESVGASVTPARNNATKRAANANKVSPEKGNGEHSVSTRDRSKIQCRYGMACRNKKCPFFHHPAAVTASNEAGDAESTGLSPTSPGSKRHADDSGAAPIRAKQGEKKNSATTPNRKAASKKKCRWGAGCRNKKCAFVHPTDGENGASQKDKSIEDVAGEGGNGFSSAAVVLALKNYETMGSQTKMNLGVSRSGVAAGASVSNGAAKGRVTTYAEKSVAPPILPPSPESHVPLQSRSMHPKDHVSSGKGYSSPGEGQKHSSSPSSSFQNGSMQTPENLPPPPSDWRNMQSRVTNPESLNEAHTNINIPEPTPYFSQDVNHNSHYFTESNGTVNNQSQSSTQPLGFGMPLSGFDSEDMNPDAEWLFEVLGLNDLIAEDGGLNNLSWQQNSNFLDEPQLFQGQTEGEFNYQHEQFEPNAVDIVGFNDIEIPMPEPIPELMANIQVQPLSVPDVEIPKIQLMADDEIAACNSAALELRLESQGKSKNPDILPALLQTCRSKQESVKAALEQSMDMPQNKDGSDAELDEANVLALLDLNELLLSSISIAESALREIEKSKTTKKLVSDKKCTKKSAKEKDASWTSVGKKQHQQSEPKQPAKSLSKHDQFRENKANCSTQTAKKSAKNANDATKDIAVEKTNVKSSEDKTPAVTFKETRPTEIVNGSKNESKQEPEPSPEDTVDAAQQEKEKMARMLEEARQKMAAARERKLSKKSKKLDKWIKEQEEMKQKRAKFWSERIAKENDYLELIQKLIVAEFLRQSKTKAMGLSAERVNSDSHASEVIAELSRDAFHVIYGELKCRIEVAGSDKKDLNGRVGTLRYWDKERERFCVGLDTKKSPDIDVHFLCPENLEMVRSTKGEKKSTMNSYGVNATDLLTYGGVSLGLSFTLDKSHIVALGSAESTQVGLQKFCTTRDEEDRQSKLAEEAEKIREEEDRKRRAARKAQENAAWERRKEQMRKEKEEYERMKREWAQERRENTKAYEHFADDSYDDDDEECNCPRCRYRDRFSSSGGAFFFSIGGIPFRVNFGDFDSDDDESFFDEFDETWERRLEEEKEEENRKQAEILGVSPDADERTIKLAYRKMALQYHPDKWKRNSEHGMTKDEAENRFKMMQSAYDHLMSNFDD